MDEAWRGDFRARACSSPRATAWRRATGSRIPPFALLRLLALQGRETDACPLIEAVIEAAATRRAGHGGEVARWAAAVLYNGLARYEEAASAARQVIANAIDPWTIDMGAPRARRGGGARRRHELARDALDARSDDAARWHRLRARHRGALPRAPQRRRGGRDLFREAIDRLGRTQRPSGARPAHLLFGEWLRREGRRREAREQLRTAEEMFTEMGMEAFADRAGRELVAAGGRPRTRRLEVREELTPQEEQIARLARDGLTNARHRQPAVP